MDFMSTNDKNKCIYLAHYFTSEPKTTVDKNEPVPPFRPDREDLLEREERIIKLYRTLLQEKSNKKLTQQKGITVEHIRAYLQKTHVEMADQYSREIITIADKSKDGIIDYGEFRKFVIAQEQTLWKLFKQIDLSRDLRLQPQELAQSLTRAGVTIDQTKLQSLVEKMDQDGDGTIDFTEWRNFLLFLPRACTLANIYQFSQDVVLMTSDGEIGVMNKGSELKSDSKLYYLIAGGFAGAVSRSLTAPLDRIKVFLQTRPAIPVDKSTNSVTKGLGSLKNVATVLYAEGGVSNFFRGNGLNVIKIIPESATKFYVFERAKAFLVGKDSPLSITDRLISGGMAGVAAQTLIYPLELIKTKRMASLKNPKSILATGREILYQQGVRGLYKGLPTALAGIFPFAAIDLTLFEVLKKTFLPKEPSNTNLVSVLGCGMISGSIGAVTVYPLSLVRTKLQAQGSPTHPKVYSSAWHVVKETYATESFRGFYKGLGPTLLKVVPALSISYVAYESSKKKLGIP